MHVLVTCKFEEDPIKTEGAIESAIFLRYSRVIIIISLFQEDNIFGTHASLTYGPGLQR